MTDLREQFRGLWLPLVTPFRNGELDETSLTRMVRHYASGSIGGWGPTAAGFDAVQVTVPSSATTGEVYLTTSAGTTVPVGGLSLKHLSRIEQSVRVEFRL